MNTYFCVIDCTYGSDNCLKCIDPSRIMSALFVAYYHPDQCEVKFIKKLAAATIYELLTDTEIFEVLFLKRVTLKTIELPDI